MHRREHLPYSGTVFGTLEIRRLVENLGRYVFGGERLDHAIVAGGEPIRASGGREPRLRGGRTPVDDAPAGRHGRDFKLRYRRPPRCLSNCYRDVFFPTLAASPVQTSLGDHPGIFGGVGDQMVRLWSA